MKRSRYDHAKRTGNSVAEKGMSVRLGKMSDPVRKSSVKYKCGMALLAHGLGLFNVLEWHAGCLRTEAKISNKSKGLGTALNTEIIHDR